MERGILVEELSIDGAKLTLPVLSRCGRCGEISGTVSLGVEGKAARELRLEKMSLYFWH